MSELLSITATARRVGLSRPRLSKLIKEHDIKKVRSGGTFLVDPSDVATLVEGLRAEGKVKEKAEVGPAPSTPTPREGATSLTRSPALPMASLDSRDIARETDELRLRVVALEAELANSQEDIKSLQQTVAKLSPDYQIQIKKDKTPFWLCLLKPWG